MHIHKCQHNRTLNYYSNITVQSWKCMLAIQFNNLQLHMRTYHFSLSDDEYLTLVPHILPLLPKGGLTPTLQQGLVEQQASPLQIQSHRAWQSYACQEECYTYIKVSMHSKLTIDSRHTQESSIIVLIQS